MRLHFIMLYIKKSSDPQCNIMQPIVNLINCYGQYTFCKYEVQHRRDVMNNFKKVIQEFSLLRNHFVLSLVFI